MLLPRPIRKIIGVFRGQVSPVLVTIAVMLGFWFGLMPGFSGLHAMLLVALVLLNLPIALFLLTAAIARGLALAAAPGLYLVGRTVQEHMDWLLAGLAKAPIVGLTEFDRMALAGALILGPAVGLALGLMCGALVKAFRRKWLRLEENSERLKRWYSKRWVRIADRLIVGKKAKDARAAMEAPTKYVRKLGLVFAVLVLAAFYGALSLVKDEVVRDRGAAMLTRTNGAEVNIAAVNLSPVQGEFGLSGIQMTDREEPTKNQVQIGTVMARTELYPMTVGKLVMEEVRVSDVAFGAQRQTPGRVVENPAIDKSEPFDPEKYGVKIEKLGTLDDYIEEAKKFKRWLEKVRRWLPESEAEAAQPEPTSIPHKYLDYLNVKADSLPQARYLARKVLLENVDLPWKSLGRGTVRLTNVSDAPVQAALPMGVELESESGLKVSLIWRYDMTEKGRVEGSFEGFDVASLGAGLGGKSLQNGKASGTFEGILNRQQMDLTVSVRLRGLASAGSGGGKLASLGDRFSQRMISAFEDVPLSVRLVGPVAEPRIVLDSPQLEQAIQEKVIEAGADEAKGELRKQIQERLGDKVPEDLTQDKAAEELLKKGLDSLLGGSKKN